MNEFFKDAIIVCAMLFIVWGPLVVVAIVRAMFSTYRPRSAPFGNRITYGNWPYKKNKKGEWVSKKTGQIARTVSLKEFLKENNE